VRKLLCIFLVLAWTGATAWGASEILAGTKNISSANANVEAKVVLTAQSGGATLQTIVEPQCARRGTQGVNPQYVDYPYMTNAVPFYATVMYRQTVGGTWYESAPLTSTVITLPAPVITSSAAPSAIKNVAFSYTITATNSPTSYGSTGTLPAGLTRSGAVISGTPTAAGDSTVTVSATNATGTGSQSTVFTVQESYHKYDAYLALTNTHDTPTTYTLRWWSTADPENEALAHETVMELQPGDTVPVHLTETYPFTYETSASGFNAAGVDGGAATAWMEVVTAATAAIDTIVTTAPTADHDIGAIAPEQPIPAANATRASGTIDTIAKQDQNSQAAATDARSDAAMVAGQEAKTTAAVVGLGAGIAGLGEKIDALGSGEGGAEETDEELAEASDEAADSATGKGIFGKVQTIGTDLGTIASAWTLTVGSPQPITIGWTLPTAIGGGAVEMDLAEYSGACSLVRAGILLAISWTFLTSILGAIKGIMS